MDCDSDRGGGEEKETFAREEGRPSRKLAAFGPESVDESR